MMLRSAASPGSVGSAGRRWRKVASSYRCQIADRPLPACFPVPWLLTGVSKFSPRKVSRSLACRSPGTAFRWTIQ